MKRIYLLMILLMTAVSSFAQADVELTKIMADTVKYSSPAQTGYIVLYRFKNKGPNSYDTSHRLVLKTFYGQNITLRFPPAGGGFPGGFPKDSTLTYADTLGFLQALTPNPKQLCDTVALVKANPMTPISDPVPANNITCKSVFSKPEPSNAVATLTEENIMNVYPNPATNTLNVAYRFKGSSKASVVIRNMVGATVYSKDLGADISGSQNFQLDISALTSGMYFVEMNVNNDKIVSKLSIQK